MTLDNQGNALILVAMVEKGVETMTRAEEIEAEVYTKRSGIWDAYDQGCWSYHKGVPQGLNPHIPGHANSREWQRGWLAEWRTRP